MKSILDKESLQELYLDKAVIGKKGIKYLSEILKNESNLTSLSMNGLKY